MTNRLTTLLAGRPAIADGGYGWLLQERGLPMGECAESWNLDNPGAVAALHDEYAAAGAVLLTTNTFGATEPRLAQHGLAGRVEEVNRAGVALCRTVAERHGALVAGNVGPTGELLEPLGTLTPDAARALFAEQVRGLRDGGADLVLVETMSDLDEARAAVAAARTEAPDLPVVATLSFDTNLRTMMGVDPATAARALADEGADAVGANCGRGPDDMRVIARQLADARPEGVLLVAQSNAGLPELDGDRFVYTVGPEAMAEHALELRELGIDVVGACCGSSPEHLRAMAEALATR
ncbi:homocysteine S-methyltransferase family protein [Phycicoccus sp.]|uniref:homocysteine S-methyltransferase family protein n=1 Tax=Phycicoccus sp. TaxID=1902410 RepID=UPI002BA48CEF|nr:homocysteine S-methyltransferase family protein [Phycicoccus sp.]HMM94165.1 homocysteine S-methyltransferase family protein [Phycicoccus sp.]